MVSLGSLALLVSMTVSQEPRPQLPRFENAQPIASLPGVMLDRRLHGAGSANSLARSRRLQGRMLWIDGTANLDRFSDEEKIVRLMAKIADSGFNTVVFDVKPISGQVLYKSKVAPKIEVWRGRKLPKDFDPLPGMVREAKKNGLEIFLSLNAFSEGHSLFKAGPGYDRQDWQTTLYEPKLFAKFDFGSVEVDLAFNRLSHSSKVSAFNTANLLPRSSIGGFAIAIDAAGRFVDGFELLPNTAFPTLPTGGSILVAQGATAGAMRTAATGSRFVRFSVEAELVRISDRPSQQYPLITDPTNPEVVARNLAILEEVVRPYPIDGILYDDRLRFSGMTGDFGPHFRASFEKWLGRKVSKWPEDVYTITYSPNLTRGLGPGREYENWLIFRALVMKRYVKTVADKVRSIRPDCQFGIYAGSWYGEYPSFGTNYASPDAEGGFWFLSPEYQKTGFAEQLDLLVTGCYYPTATIFDAMSTGREIGRTVEASAALSTRVAYDSTWVYAGIALDQFKNDPQGLMNAIQAACGASQGVMVFDLSHNIDPMWPVFKQAFSQTASPPTKDRSLLAVLRRMKAQAIRNGVVPTPITVSSGQAGAGH